MVDGQWPHVESHMIGLVQLHASLGVAASRRAQPLTSECFGAEDECARCILAPCSPWRAWWRWWLVTYMTTLILLALQPC